MLLRLSMRVSELCSLRSSSIKWSRGRFVATVTVNGGRKRRLPFPVKAINAYLALDADRRTALKTDGETAFLFQPLANCRTLVHDKALSPRMIEKIVGRCSASREAWLIQNAAISCTSAKTSMRVNLEERPRRGTSRPGRQAIPGRSSPPVSATSTSLAKVLNAFRHRR